MAEQLLTMGTINEESLKCILLKQARQDIGVALLANSGMHACS